MYDRVVRYILNSSGSMNGLEHDTIGGFNSILQKQSQIINLSEDESGEAMNELSMNGIKFLSKTLENDSELAAVLNGFGITKEQLDMLVTYGQG